MTMPGTPPVILSVDIGSSSLKAALIDFDGRLAAFSRSAYSMGALAADWEKALALTLKDLNAELPQCSIEGLCISGNGPTLVPVKRDGLALPPLYWFDEKHLTQLERAGPESAESARSESEKAASFFLPHAAWFKGHSNEYERVGNFFSSHEWLSFKLGADPFTALPHSLYETYYWDEEQCRLFGLDRKKFPAFVKMGTLVGKVSAQAARSYGPGLKQGIPIVAGAPDFITALLGTRTVMDGDVCDRAGSSEGINLCASQRPSLNGGLRVLPHAMEGLWNIGLVIPLSGRLFESYRSATGQEKRPYGEHLAELIPKPYVPASWPPNPQTQVPNSPLDLGRSVLCEIAFAVRAAIGTLGAFGFPVRRMRVSGGQGKNPLWNQLKADITGLTLQIPEINDAELTGNVMLCAVALSLNTESNFENALIKAMDKMIRFRDLYKPNPETASFWEESFKFYLEKTGNKSLQGKI